MEGGSGFVGCFRLREEDGKLGGGDDGYVTAGPHLEGDTVASYKSRRPSQSAVFASWQMVREVGGGVTPEVVGSV